MMEKTIEKHFSKIVQLIRKAKNEALKSVNTDLVIIVKAYATF